MSDYEISTIFNWSLIALAWIVPPVMRKLNWDKNENMFQPSLVGMYLLMMAAGSTVSMLLTDLN